MIAAILVIAFQAIINIYLLWVLRRQDRLIDQLRTGRTWPLDQFEVGELFTITYEGEDESGNRRWDVKADE